MSVEKFLPFNLLNLWTCLTASLVCSILVLPAIAQQPPTKPPAASGTPPAVKPGTKAPAPPSAPGAQVPGNAVKPGANPQAATPQKPAAPAQKPAAPPAPVATPAPAKAPATAAAKVTEVEADRALSELELQILKSVDQLVIAFNKADVELLVDSFVSGGELIDEQGNIHQGHDTLRELAKAFFTKFPGAQTEAELESVRQVNDLVLGEGTRAITTKDGKSMAVLRFNAIWAKTDKGFKLVSFRDFSEAISVLPHEALTPLSWLIGEWVSEGPGVKVNMNYKWSDDENFIVGDIKVTADDQSVSTSTQRIGWDANASLLRSWTFDSDGGFGEAIWFDSDEGWAMDSIAITPIGQVGSAIVSIVPVSDGRFKLIGTDRSVDDAEAPDFEVTVVRNPPQPKK